MVDVLSGFDNFRTPEFYNWAFMRTCGDHIQEMWNKIPEGIDILVTHGPPLGEQNKTFDHY